jgi:predicted dehydrogenase
MIKAGIIGLGRMGFSHCAIVNAQPDIELVAICEPTNIIEEVIKKYTNLTCYKDYKKMINSLNMDCIFITTPTKFHFEMVKYSIEAGLHVFVEKPFCLNPLDGAELVELAAHKGVVNQVGYHNRFIGTFVEAKRLLELGSIGEVYHILGEAYGPVVLKEKGLTWRSKTSEGGGCLYDYATHVINLIQFLVGSPERISGSSLKKIYSRNVDDGVYASLYFRGDLTGQLSVNWSDETYRKMSTQITILGKKGKIIVDAQELKIYFRETPADSRFEKGWNMRWVTDLSPDVKFYLRGEEYSAQIEYFLECIKNKKFDNINSFASAYATDCVADLIKLDAKASEVA